MSRFDFVFCDLDGTLLDDKLRHYKCYQDIVRHYGGKCISLEEYWEDKRNKVKRTELLEKTNFGGTYDEYVSEWNRLIETDKYISYETLKPDAILVLKWLRENSKHLVLVTMRQDMNILRKQLLDFNLIQYFDEIVKGDPIKERKEDLLNKQYGENSIVIGDTEADQQLARKIGSKFIAVVSGLRDARYFVDEKYCIFYLSELINIVL